MQYTCAYFPCPDLTLEQAQIAKMHYICRKLRLKEGEAVVDAGCGWGGLALFMARHYGVSVRAYNISHEQVEFARTRAQAQGLQARVEYVEDDYRNICGQRRFTATGTASSPSMTRRMASRLSFSGPFANWASPGSRR
jgi:cyclopropane-fatty-acyl-phospholipid synthase